ncbi:MAG: DUF2339 domain-containing protein, partial [Alphaproteobacteria bacterium]
MMYVLLTVSAVIAGPILAIIALAEVRRLRRQVWTLRAQLAALPGAMARPAAPESDPILPSPAGDATDREAPPVPGDATNAAAPEDAGLEEAEPAQPPRAAAKDGRTLEENLASRWLVWLAGLALALGGFFFGKYVLEQGLLGPLTRILAGTGLGLALIAAGEWLRRRPLERALASVRPSHLPPALTAAGVFTMFASVYIAFAVYVLLPPLAAFLLLAAIAALAVLLSLRQGPFIAVLGLAGGFVTPALVTTSDPSAASLFVYLIVLVTCSLAVVRHRGWWWLAWIAVAGATLWPLVWFVGPWQASDAAIVGSFALAVLLAFALVRHDAASLAEAMPPPVYRLDRFPLPERIAAVAAVAMAVVVFVLVRVDGYGPVSLVTLTAFGGATLVLARREAIFDALPFVSAVLTTAALAAWHLPRIVAARRPLFVLEGQPVGPGTGPIVPPELEPFIIAAALFAILFAAGGFAALRGARRPALWASLSAATPLAILAVAYWRVEAFDLDLGWAAVAMAVGFVYLAAAERVSRGRGGPGMDGALGAYAAGVVAALSLALVMSLEQAWLTVALSLQLPALAWIDGRLRLGALGRVALVLAALVLVRLTLNPFVLDYALGPGLGWVAYGYGLPAIAFFAAARQFRRRDTGLLITVLEAGALVFSVLLVTFEIRSLIAGSLGDLPVGFAERSVQTVAWAAIALMLYVRALRRDNVVLLWGWRILAALATAQVVGLQVLLDNPLLSPHPVGTAPVFNLVLLAYGAPAVLAGLFAYHGQRHGDSFVAMWAGVLALVLAFIAVSLEIRHAFHGSILAYGPTGDGEWYAYSAGWLAYAGVLLVPGIWRGLVPLRYASLAIVMLTVAKVFLLDMSNLAGALRA